MRRPRALRWTYFGDVPGVIQRCIGNTPTFIEAGGKIHGSEQAPLGIADCDDDIRQVQLLDASLNQMARQRMYIASPFLYANIQTLASTLVPDYISTLNSATATIRSAVAGAYCWENVALPIVFGLLMDGAVSQRIQHRYDARDNPNGEWLAIGTEVEAERRTRWGGVRTITGTSAVFRYIWMEGFPPRRSKLPINISSSEVDLLFSVARNVAGEYDQSAWARLRFFNLVRVNASGVRPRNLTVPILDQVSPLGDEIERAADRLAAPALVALRHFCTSSNLRAESEMVALILSRELLSRVAFEIGSRLLPSVQLLAQGTAWGAWIEPRGETIG